MRIAKLSTAAVVVGLLACGGYSAPTAPSGGNGAYGGGGGGGGGTGSNAGGGTSGGTGAIPLTAAVTVGNDFFKSGRNGTVNAAVDTVAVGGSVTWTWASNGNVPHSVQSIGSPVFTSSGVQTPAGSTYQVTFPSGGTYHYQCIVHGSAMSGTIVVR
jgi:plastocyanin